MPSLPSRSILACGGAFIRRHRAPILVDIKRVSRSMSTGRSVELELIAAGSFGDRLSDSGSASCTKTDVTMSQPLKVSAMSDVAEPPHRRVHAKTISGVAALAALDTSTQQQDDGLHQLAQK
ncbi:hypothetical protein ON010_g8414 [Phytophthora cinnamomi]|nr:hypothetical protein ON010_g8414 [Phytophthora cinnamomi]